MATVNPRSREQQYDAVVLHSKSDASTARKIQLFIQRFIPPLKDGNPPLVCLFTCGDRQYSQSRYQRLEETVRRSTFIYMLMTEHFVNEWNTLEHEACILKTIYDQNKQSCLIPMYLRRKPDFKIPFCLSAFQALYLNEIFIRKDKFLENVKVEDIRQEDLNQRLINKISTQFNDKIDLKDQRQKSDARRQAIQRAGKKDMADEQLDAPVSAVPNSLETRDCLVPPKEAFSLCDEPETIYRGPKILTEEQININEEQQIGAGGYAEVFLGEWQKRKTAVKRLKPEVSDLNISKEKAVSFLRHPYLLPILAFGDNQPIPRTFIFPFKENGDLRSLIKTANFPDGCSIWKDFIRIAYQIAEGLSYLHRSTPGRNAIRHGDLKPANILLDENYNACICDMGLATEMPEGRIDVTRTGAYGTQDFIDPLIHKRGTKMPENDIYSFGIVLVQILLLSVDDTYSSIIKGWEQEGGWTPKNIENEMKRRDIVIWKTDEKDSIGEDTVKELIQTVLDCKRLEGRISVQALRGKFKDILKRGNVPPYIWVEKPICAMCHFFPVAEKIECCKCQKGRFCVGCLSLHYINPLFCPNCGDCQPPIGGTNTYAVLIAGGGNGKEVFINDVRRMKNCLSDPRITGVTENNIMCFFPEDKYCKDSSFKSTRRNVFDKLNELQSCVSDCEADSTLILYISCHSKQRVTKEIPTSGISDTNKTKRGVTKEIPADGVSDTNSTMAQRDDINDDSPTDGQSEAMNTKAQRVYSNTEYVNDEESSLTWSLGEEPEDELNSADLKNMISNLNFKVIVTMLDCCFAGSHVLPFGRRSQQNKTMIQWSSCKLSEKSLYSSSSSYFTQYIIAGLTCSNYCPNDPIKNTSNWNDCMICRSFYERANLDQCIVFSILQEYVFGHMKENKKGLPTPRSAVDGDTTQIKLAYFNAQPLTTKVWYKARGIVPKLLLLDYTLDELKDLKCLKKAIYRKLKDLGLLENLEMITEESFTKMLCFDIPKGKGICLQEPFSEVKDAYRRFDIIECILEDHFQAD